MFGNRQITETQLRWFGISLSSMIGILGLLTYWRWHWIEFAIVSAVVAFAISAIFYGVPNSRRPIHRAFSIAVKPIQVIVTFALLGIVYYGVMTPIALFLRLRGHDALNRRHDCEGGSLWSKRDLEPPAERYFETY